MGDQQRRQASETYLAKLRDPRWQKKRLQVLERDRWECQFCFDAKSTLHVHHRIYSKGREPWDIDEDLLVTLCESCHLRQTEQSAAAREGIARAFQAHFFTEEILDLADYVIDSPVVRDNASSGILMFFFHDQESFDLVRERYFAHLKRHLRKDVELEQ